MRSSDLARLEREFGELVARHEGSVDFARFEPYADDFPGFVRDILGETDPGLWSRQLEIAEAVRDHRKVVVYSGHGVGKDHLAGRFALWWLYTQRGKVLVTAPVERTAIEVAMKEIAAAFHGAPNLPGELYRKSLRIPGYDIEDVGVLAMTATAAGGLTGHHAPRTLAIITEGNDVEGFAYEGFQGCLVTEEDRWLVLGNPTADSTPRFRTICESPVWHQIRIPVWDHPNVVHQETRIPGAVTQAWIEDVEADYGRDSNYWTSRVEARFPEETADALLRRSWIRRAVELHGEEGFIPDRRNAPIVFSVDVARFGPNRSALMVSRGDKEALRVEEIKTWRNLDGPELVDRIMEEVTALREREMKFGLRRFNGTDPTRWPARIVVDETGVGGPILDMLRKRLSGSKVIGFLGARRAIQDGRRYRNRRSRAFWKVREMLQAGRLAIPDDEGLREELRAIEWGVNAQDKVEIASKEDLRLGRSPDLADCLSQICWAVTSGRVRRPSAPLIKRW